MYLVHFSSYLSMLSVLVVCLSDEMPRILFDIIVVGAARAGDHISDGDLASGSNISHSRVRDIIHGARYKSERLLRITFPYSILVR